VEGAELWEDIPTQEAVHIENVADYEPYNTDPPTSGAHYGDPMQPADPGLYQEPIPDENLVHSLEHGYVIIWYDCSALTENGCAQVQQDIDEVIAETGTFKVIGMPRAGMDQPVIMTSWGRMMRLEGFDREKVVNFIEVNRGRAPEPDGP
jgi:hypothetical protein